MALLSFLGRIRGALAFVGVGIAPTKTTLITDVPTVRSGSAAASESEPAGSVYLRTGVVAGRLLNLRSGNSTWVPVECGGTTGTAAAPIDMAGATHTLVLGTAGAAQTKLAGYTIFVDANTGSAPEDLVLPAAADLAGVTLRIVNVGGEQVTVNTNKLTLETLEGGFIVSDGTAWTGYGVGTVT